eukprot:CAMPEP_0201549636 /NCGR_PEP_ID=MMETSP0173_2-20130828/6082_1 /ASSEMBLY_ACC=CAM_ASM_000268 /TAXON_ID=218659 /ORGANISM="Vexillifera sp., Strain DIVA3 564/2" /LENGTH=1139 /DNA_ID=CAMNT_0047959369 /DNA_START=56 /DNA_END=3475 /DNA_ORIENTATION=+
MELSEDRMILESLSFVGESGEHFEFQFLEKEKNHETIVKVDDRVVTDRPSVEIFAMPGNELFPRFTLLQGKLFKGHFLHRDHHWVLEQTDPSSVCYTIYDAEAWQHEEPMHCGNGDHKHNVRDLPSLGNAPNDAIVNPAPGPCPQSLQTMTLGFAVDNNAFVNRFSSSTSQTEADVADLVTFLSDLYATTVNVEFTLAELVIRTTAGDGLPWNTVNCQSVEDKLDAFTSWRENQADYGLWHLLTRCYSSGTVGLAWTGVTCAANPLNGPNGRPAGNTAVSSYIENTGHGVVAHEIGHNFGAPHDNEGIMIPSNINSGEFTATSQTEMCADLSANDGCLTNSNCTPDCTGRECGSNGCGGSCSPGCSSGFGCNTSGQCVAQCQPNCAGKNCGSDGCGGTCSPGCSASQVCSNSGVCEAASTTAVQDAIMSAVNSARSNYPVLSNSIQWNNALGQEALNAISACSWPNVNQAAIQSVSSYSLSLSANGPPSASRASDHVQSAINAAENGGYNCQTDSCTNNCGLYRNIIGQNLQDFVCVTQVCPGNTSPFGNGQSWDFTLCVASGWVPNSQHPLGSASSCSAACQPTTSCEANALQCGTIFDGCNTQTCGSGSCSAPFTCENNNCVCTPQTQCFTNQCGTVESCAGTHSIECGTCGTNQDCIDNQCVTTCTPDTSISCDGKQCGSVFDGCQHHQCGSCSEGDQCDTNNLCYTPCDACSPFATCTDSVAGTCQCNTGYTGDGFQCVEEQTPPSPSGPSCSNADFGVMFGSASAWNTVQSGNGCSMSISNAPSINVLTFSQLHSLGTESRFAVAVTRTSSSGDIGIVAGASGPGTSGGLPDGHFLFYWDASSGNFQFEAKIEPWGWGWKPSPWSGVSSWPVGETKVLGFTYNSAGGVVPTVDGVSQYTYTINGWSSPSQFGVFAGSGVTGSFSEFALFSQSSLVVELWGCYTDSELISMISNMLNIPASQIGSIEGNNCASKREVGATSTFTVNLVNAPGSRSAAALSAQLQSALASGNVGGSSVVGVAPVSGGPTIVESPAVPTSGGGGGGSSGLSGGAIAGIVVGSVAAAVIATGGVYWAATRGGDEDEEVTAVEENKRGSVRKSLFGLFSAPKGGVNLDPGADPSGHKSITARHHGRVEK